MDNSQLSVSFDTEGNIFFNRESNGEIVQSLKLTRQEAITILIPSMVDDTGFAEKMTAELRRHLNHK